MRYLFSCLKKIQGNRKTSLEIVWCRLSAYSKYKTIQESWIKASMTKKSEWKKMNNAHILEIFHSIFTTELDLFWNHCKQVGGAGAPSVQVLQECNVFDDDLQNWKAAVMYQILFDDSFFTEYDKSAYFYIHFSRQTHTNSGRDWCIDGKSMGFYE